MVLSLIQIIIIISVIPIAAFLLYRFFCQKKLSQSIIKNITLNHHRKHAIEHLLIEKKQLKIVKHFVKKSLVIETETGNTFYSKHAIINYNEDNKFVRVSILASNNSLTEEIKRKINNELRDINLLNSRNEYEYIS